MPTSTYRRHTEALAAAKTGTPLLDWVAGRLGEGMSWRAIPGLLEAATGGDVRVTRQTLRTWWHDDGRHDVAA